MKSMASFLPILSKEYEVKIIEVRGMMIDEARNFIVEKFLESGFEYLLFLDDDHEGHTVDMVNHLLSLKTYVSSIKCYARYFAHLPNLLEYSGEVELDRKYRRKSVNAGDQECDLVGFGMTLIRRCTFDMITKPYFFCDTPNRREDNYFCDKLISHGIRPIGCFDYCLSHDGITEEIADKLRAEGMENVVGNILEKNPNADLSKMVLVT